MNKLFIFHSISNDQSNQTGGKIDSACTKTARVFAGEQGWHLIMSAQATLAFGIPL